MAEYILSAEIQPVLARNFAASTRSQVTKALAGVDASVKLSAKLDTSAAKTQIAKFTAAARSDIKFKAALDEAGLSAKVKTLAERASTDVTLRANVDDKAALAKLRELQRTRSAKLNVNADVGSAVAGLSRLQLLAVGIGAAIGGVGSVLPTALAGGVGAAGALGGSLFGVAKALTAYQQEQDKASKTAATGASQALSSAIAIRNAQQGVDSARRSAARVAEESARQISDSEQAVSDAEREVARAQDDALRAQAAINDARQQAARDLQDQRDKVAGYALTQEDAQVALLRAQENLTKVNGDYRSSELDKREAALQVAEAQQRIVDLGKQQARDTEDLNTLQRQGIEGSQQVVSAKQAEESANQRVADSQESLRKAETDLTRTRVDAARQQEDAAIQVAQAIQAVTDAQDRSGASADSAAASASKFADQMAKLSPAAQSFTRQLLGMGDAWQRFQGITQTATLPGLQDMLRGLESLEGPATAGVAAIGREVGTLGTRAGELFKNPLFQGRLQAAFENAVPVVHALGDGLLQVTDRMVTFAANNAQLSNSTAKAVTDLAKAVGDFYDGLQPHVAGIGRLIEGLGTLTRDVAGGLGTLFGQVSSAYAQNAGTFETTFRKLLDTLLQFSASALPAVSNGLSVLAQALQVVNSILQPFISFLGGLGGYVAAGVIALKLLSATASGVGSAFAAINPADVGKKIEQSDLGKKIGSIGSAAEGGAASTGKFSSALGSAGRGALTAAKYIPLVGLAVSGGAAALDGFAPSLDSLAQKYLQGGKAAQEAASKTYQLSDGWAKGGPLGFFFRDSMEQVRAKASDLYAAMSPLERAQTDVNRTQNDLTEAINKYGPQSAQAKTATDLYAFAQRDLKDAQWAAEQATKTHTDKIRDQQQAMLEQANGLVGYNASMLRVESAQQAVRTAVAQYGAQSIQARQAQNDLESALLGSVTAADQLARAQTQGIPPSQQNAYAQEAVNIQLAKLSQQAGTDLPPALQNLVNHLSDSDIAAFGAKSRMDDLGNRIVTMPDGKTITFPTNAADTQRIVDGLGKSVDHVATVYEQFMSSYLDFLDAVTKKPKPSNAPTSSFPFPLPTNATGGYISGPGTATSDSIVARLSNGEFVVNAAATRRNLPLLQAINARYARGGLVGFADGGQVAAGAGTSAVSFTVPDLSSNTEQFNELTAAVSALVDAMNTQLVPTLQVLEQHLGTAMPTANNTLLSSTWALNGGITAAWLANQNAVWSSTNQQTAAFGVLQSGLAQVRAAMQATADWAVTQYGRVWAAAADPIRAVLNGPVNAGLIGAWNSLNGQFALNHPVAPVAVPFATGGYVSGPGSGTSDSIAARLSNGEYVIPAAVTSKVRPFLDALRVGQGEALEAAGYRPGFATGGLVANTGSQLNATVAHGLGWLSQQAGKPYVWGAVGPTAYDCSGLMSALVGVLRGDANPYRRLGVAESQPWPGFVSGLSSAFSTGFNSHHTAGTLAGVNAEARDSGIPVLVGPRAAGADSSQFTGTASLPLVGGRFTPGGGSFDPAGIVSAFLQDAIGSADGIAGQWPGNVAANAAAGLVHRAVEAIVPAGGNILGSVLATTASAGSPQVVAAVRAVASRYGWGDGPEWSALSNLINGESGWNPNAHNPTSSAAGLFQKLTSLHGPLEPTVSGQAEWGLSYIRNNPQYGDPITAWSKWLSRSPHWYDQGGYLPRDPGTYSITKGTSKPEAVLDPKSTAAYIAHANALQRGQHLELGQYTVNRLTAAIVAAMSERPIHVTTKTGLGVEVPPGL